jgi:hypothetical protein
MALIRYGGLVSEIRGSLAGTVFSRNKGGAYIRNRTVPINPNTSFQQIVRNIMGNLSNTWVDTLTAIQREGWETYAANLLLPDKLGDMRAISGNSMYVRCNTARVQAGLVREDDAPIVFVNAETDPSLLVTGDATADEVDVVFDNTLPWANEDDASMAVYVSRPQNPTVNYFEGPYRFAGKIDGDAITAPTSPAAIPAPFGLTAAQKVFIRTVVLRADGSISESMFRGGLCS